MRAYLTNKADYAVFVKRDDKGDLKFEVSFDQTTKPRIKIIDNEDNNVIRNLSRDDARWLIEALEDVMELTKQKE